MTAHPVVPERSNIDVLMAFLGAAAAVTVDDGPYLHGWDLATENAQPDNEVVRFSWTDGEFYYDCVLTEAGIRGGKFIDDGKFVCDDRNGEKTVIRFFTIVPITTLPTPAAA